MAEVIQEKPQPKNRNFKVSSFPRFNNSAEREFSQVLTRRVNDYFKSQKFGRHANLQMVLKTIFMLSLFFIPYFIYIFGEVSLLVFYALVFVQGFGKAGIGLSIMHDANHGAYSRYKWVNQLLGYTLNLVGGNATNWKIQHNIMHHTYTNIAGHDEDISPRPILRFSPHSEVRPYHKYQFIYAWFLYGLMTITWISFKDFKQFSGYTKSGIINRISSSTTRSWLWLIGTKIVYFGYALVIPMLVLPFAWWHVLLGFILMHYVAGFLLGIVFQPAHVMEENEYPLPEDGGFVDDNFMVHQLKTTCNFAHKNRIFSWFVGGLNYQVEHHLFPNVCHVHYRKLSKIVEQTAHEYGFPYKSIRSFREALVLHGRMLYKLGRA